MQKSDLAIFAALTDEIRITKSKMQVDESVSVKPARIVKGQYIKMPLILVRTGVGKSAMADAVSYCVQQYRPSACLNVGYCGGTIPEMTVGDLLIADKIVDAMTDEEFRPTANLLAEAKEKCEKENVRHFVGGMVTVDEPITTPHEKAFIGTKHEVKGVEMESYAFARICEELGIAYGVVRAVLDPMDMILPDFEDAVDEEGETSIYGAIKHMIKKPKDILTVPKIEYCAVQAREAIAKFIDVWLGVEE
jgi:adenosylhomocysteine nucleosidase